MMTNEKAEQILKKYTDNMYSIQNLTRKMNGKVITRELKIFF